MNIIKALPSPLLMVSPRKRLRWVKCKWPIISNCYCCELMILNKLGNFHATFLHCNACPFSLSSSIPQKEEERKEKEEQIVILKNLWERIIFKVWEPQESEDKSKEKCWGHPKCDILHSPRGREPSLCSFTAREFNRKTCSLITVWDPVSGKRRPPLPARPRPL